MSIAVNGGSNQLILSGCVCPGHVATYECTIVGGFATVWQGSAFNCTGNEISLLHNRFMLNQEKIAECNDGAIVGRNLRIENDCYISQLNVTVSYNMLGKDIKCVQDDGTNIQARLSIQIIKTAGIPIPECYAFINYDSVILCTTYHYLVAPYPPPDKIYISLVDIGSKMLTFIWSPVAPECPAIRYNIVASNCGSCPTTTNHTTVTCTDVPSDSTCNFTVQTVFCGNTTSTSSDSVQIALKGMQCASMATLLIDYCLMHIIILSFRKV